MTKRKVLLTALVALVRAAVAHAEWHLDGDTSIVYDSNLSNSDRSADIRDDWAWRGNVRAVNGFQLTRDLRLNVSGDLRGEIWDRFGSFNSAGPGAEAGLRYRFGLGRQSPWISLQDRFGYDRFEETEQSGYDNVVQVRSGVALSDRIAVEVFYGFENHTAPDDFYDRQDHRAGMRLIFDVTSALQVELGYSYREGDVISYAVPPRDDIAAFAVEREDEDEFGKPLRTAYKLLGRTQSVSTAIGYQVTKNASVQLSYQYAVTTHDPLEYEKHLVEAKVAFAF